MNNENNEHNIVNPTNVDLNRVQVNQEDNMLNRERANIVSASIQANEAIDEKKALDVNNEIKIKKVNPIVKIIAIIFAFLLAGIGGYYALKLVDKIMTYDDKPTSEVVSTTTSKVSAIESYTKDLTKVRKYESENHILLLSPSINNELKFLYLEINDSGVINGGTGDYNLISEGVNSNRFTLLYGSEGLINGSEVLRENDTEYKTYKSKDNNAILIINGTPKYEYAMYINNDEVYTGKFIEDESKISLDNGVEFNKNNMDIIVNGVVLEYVY